MSKLSQAIRRRVAQPGLLFNLARLRRARRGAISVAFAATALTFLGLAGLATEVGYWYVENRSGQNTADAAALGGAKLKLLGLNTAQVQTAGLDLALRNGIDAANTNCSSTNDVRVCVNNPPAAGSRTADNNAVEVTVTRKQKVTFGKLFGLGTTFVSNRAVATKFSQGTACVLALTTQLRAGGNDTITGPNCVIASNGTGSDSCYIYGSAIVNAESVTCVGGCVGCWRDETNLDSPATPYSDPTANPFASLTPSVLPNGGSFTNTDCINFPNVPSNGSVTIAPYESNGNKVYCNNQGDLQISGNRTVNLQPGTHIFYNASFRATGGAVVCTACFDGSGNIIDGVNIILAGTAGNIGEVNINGGADIVLPAKSNNATVSQMNGVLFYRVPGAGGNVTVNGDSESWWAGAMYFPDQTANINGNASTASATVTVTLPTGAPVASMTVKKAECMLLVAADVDISGNANTYFENSGCTALGIPSASLSNLQFVRLVE